MISKICDGCSFHFLRLLPGEDVRQTLQAYCIEKKVSAASIISSVGSLKKVKLRKANENSFYESEDAHEILTTSGLLSLDGVHIHLSVSDKNALVFGGHLSEGNIVFSTLELVVAVYPNTRFKRIEDPKTGFLELSF